MAGPRSPYHGVEQHDRNRASRAADPGRRPPAGKGRMSRRPLLLLLLAAALAATGCRRAPANPPQLYEKEAAALAEVIKAKKAAEAQQYVGDRYAWEGTRRSIDRLPDRLTDTHERIKAEMELLRLVIHGPKKGK